MGIMLWHVLWVLHDIINNQKYLLKDTMYIIKNSFLKYHSILFSTNHYATSFRISVSSFTFFFVDCHSLDTDHY